MKSYDLIIIGGGIMGLMTAYYASEFYQKILIIEKRQIGNKKAASFSITRSIRNDYLDPYYARLANEARNLWEDLNQLSADEFIINCGCLNIAKKSITPDIYQTYAAKSNQVLAKLKMPNQRLNKKQLFSKYPQFKADFATLDKRAGFLYLPVITSLLTKLLNQKKITILENFNVKSIVSTEKQVSILSDSSFFRSKKLVITAGMWTNSVLKLIKQNQLVFPVTYAKPKQCKYFVLDNMKIYSEQKMPVFAYLDIGIYGHPLYEGKTKGIKIGYYDPKSDIGSHKNKIRSISDFIEKCMPELKRARSFDVKDADQCYYDFVADNDFIVGKLPGFRNILVGCGWNGTGYKFSTLVGKSLAQLAYLGKTRYDIKRFSPERFFKKAW